MGEIIANFQNKEFLDAVRTAFEGDEIQEKYGVLTVVKKFEVEGEYEERLSPTVLYRRTFGPGVLLKKQNSNAFVFVPQEVL